WLEKPVAIAFARRTKTAGARAAFAIFSTLLAGDALWILRALSSGGQIEFHGRGSAGALIRYVAPYLLLWAFAAAAFLARRAPSVTFDGEAWRWPRVSPYARTIFLYALINLPLIASVVYWVASGYNAKPPNSWRGGGNPTDVLYLILPSVLHPLWGDAVAN